MKNFIELFKSAEAKILAFIKSDDLPVSSVDGISVAQNGLSYDDAVNVTEKSNAYNKESSQFKTSTKYFVVSKNAFMTFLNEQVNCNLFLLQDMAKDLTTQTHITDECYNVMYYRNRNFRIQKWDLTGNLFILIMAPCMFFMVINSEEKVSLGLSIFLGIVIFCMLCVIFSITITEYKERTNGLKMAKAYGGRHVISNDILINGYDTDGYLSDNESEKCKRKSINLKLNFLKKFDYSAIVRKSISLSGVVGYIIEKTGHDISFTKEDYKYQVAIDVKSKIIPVIILKESIIFATEHLDYISESAVFPGLYNEEYEKVISQFFEEHSYRLFLK